MHARAVVASDRFRQEGRRFAIGGGDIVDHVFVDLQIVGGVHQGAEFNAQLVLRRRHFVVMLLNLEAHFLHHLEHFAAQVLAGIDRRHREIAALDTGAMAEIAVFEFPVAGVRPLGGVDFEIAFVHFGGEFDIVENEKLSFRTEIGGVADAQTAHVGDRRFRGRARATFIGLVGRRFQHVAENRHRRLGRERIHDRGRQIRAQVHVGFVDRFPAGDRRAVEHETLDQAVFIDGAYGLRQMLHFTARVGETEIDELHVVLLDHFHYAFDIRHGEFPS